MMLGGRFGRVDALLGAAAATILMSVVLASLVTRPTSIDARATALDRQLRCPTCQGVSIADSPATSADQMRALVREQVAAGASDSEIRAFFVERYGRWILLDPPTAGLDLALWALPALVVGLGSAVVIRRARAPAASSSLVRSSTARIPRIGRLPTMLITAAMVLALAVPIAAAVGPRLIGQEVTGQGPPQTAVSIEELAAFVAVRPDDVEALVALGDALLAAGRVGEATEQYRAALTLDPNNVSALLGVGAILLAAERPDAAWPVFDRIVAMSPDHADALLYRAVARLRMAGAVTDDVRADVERFLRVADPDDPRREMAAGLVDRAGPVPDVSSPGSPSASP